MEILVQNKPFENYKPLFEYASVYRPLVKPEDRKSQTEAFFETVTKEKAIERDVTNFIKHNDYKHIPASLFDFYNFGHHDAYVFYEFPLGNKYRADFLLVGKSSDGFHFVFVECEAINGSIIIADNTFGECVRKGKTQIENWSYFLEQQWDDVYHKLLEKTIANTSLPKEFTFYDSSRIHFLIIAGRRSAYTEEAQRRVRN